MPIATHDDVRRARRILIYGVTGSGKSTAATAIGAARKLPVHLFDEEFGWLPGWTQPAATDLRARVAPVAAEPEWVFDTAYSSCRDLIEPRAEVMIALDYPRWVSLSRLVKRTLLRVTRRERVCNGNVETLGRALSKESIIVWHFRSFGTKRCAIREQAAKEDGVPVLVIRRPRELGRLVSSLTSKPMTLTRPATGEQTATRCPGNKGGAAKR